MRNILSISCHAVLLLVLSVCSASHAQDSALRDVAKNTLDSVVTIVLLDALGQETKFGSGFFVQDGLIATNYHVISESTSGYVTPVNTHDKYEITGYMAISKELDLAIVAVEGLSLVPLNLESSGNIRIGDAVYAAGNPKGLTGTFSDGIVSSLRIVDSKSMIQMTTPISQGSSGGPLVNSKGNVVGVVTASFTSAQNANFAVPAGHLQALLLSANILAPLGGLRDAAEEGKRIVGDQNRTTFANGRFEIFHMTKIPSNGYVYDKETKLLWQRDDSASFRNFARVLRRSPYVEYYNRGTIKKYRAWRVPSESEIRSLALDELSEKETPFLPASKSNAVFWCFSDSLESLMTYVWDSNEFGSPTGERNETALLRLVQGPLELSQ